MVTQKTLRRVNVIRPYTSKSETDVDLDKCQIKLSVSLYTLHYKIIRKSIYFAKMVPYLIFHFIAGSSRPRLHGLRRAPACALRA